MSTNNELAAAVERYRTTNYDPNGVVAQVLDDIYVDACKIANAYVAEQDPTPIDQEFIKNLGWIYHQPLRQWSVDIGCIRLLWWPGNTKGEWLIDKGLYDKDSPVVIAKTLTRGQLTRLVKVLKGE